MTVFRVPAVPHPAVPHPAERHPAALGVPPPFPPWGPPPGPAPAAGLLGAAAGLLGMASAVLAALTGSFLVLLTAAHEQGVAGLLAGVVVLVGSHFAGALLVLCRRSPWLLVVTSVPLAGVGAVVLFARLAGLAFGGGSAWGVPVGMGSCAAVAAALASSWTVRGWTAARGAGSPALRQVPRCP